MADVVNVRYLGPSGSLIVEEWTFTRDQWVVNVPVKIVDRIRVHLPGHPLEIGTPVADAPSIGIPVVADETVRSSRRPSPVDTAVEKTSADKG